MNDMNVAVFTNDDSVAISLLDHPLSNEFRWRDGHEVLFRRINTFLIKHNVITRNIVDLGAWIGDNSIPWAKNIKGLVYAIDPSPENCEFIKTTCELNGIPNVKTIQTAVSNCAELLTTDDGLDHCSFVYRNTGLNGKVRVNAVSLDSLYEAKAIENVGYIHLDVEGMEYKVLEGSAKLIDVCRPIISFEQHLDLDDYDGIVAYLKPKGYTIFLVDEVLPGCRPDCRNSFAFPNELYTESLIGAIHAHIGRPLLIRKELPACSSTVVTMYFNIKDLPDSTAEVRPKSFYMEKGRVTLGLPAPMVVFCDETCVEDIRRLRGDLPTHYIVKSIAEYDFYKDHYPIIKANREGQAAYVGSRNTVSYCLLTVFKFHAMRIAAELDPFKTSHYAWVDFGGSHILRRLAEEGPAMLAAPHPKVSFCYIHYRGAAEMTMTSAFASGGCCGVGATCFTVERDYVRRFYSGCMSIFHELVLHGLGHHEEQIMAYFYHRYPELCTIYYGDYYSIVTNYHGAKEDIPSIRHFFINEAKAKGRSDLAAAALRSLDG
jgi:FkbM family methyltransferase